MTEDGQNSGKKVGIKRPEKRLHSGQWKALCGFLVMISTVSLVWAILATVTLLQRNHDLAKVTEELMDLREDIRLLHEDGAPEIPLDDLLDDYLPTPEPDDADLDPFAIFEDELGIFTDEE
jgi:hypothetical protein